MSEEKIKLLGKTPTELSEIAVSVGLKPFVGKQIASWLYVSKVGSIDQMTNISLTGRERLKEVCCVGKEPYAEVFTSKDGTRKYLFDFSEESAADPGLAIEAVTIPTEDRCTICVSCQRGCKMGCRFCMTGRQGFHGNLDAAQILSQFLSVDEDLSNAVFMGMGEPLDNFDEVLRAITVLTAPWGFAWSPKRITLSTVGISPKLEAFLEQTSVHLAVSLHNPFPAQRLELMPVQKAFPLAESMEIIRRHDWSGQRRVSFEYTMFDGWNDSFAHADSLARLLSGLECRVNLIRFHAIEGFPYKTCPENKMLAFEKRLQNRGVQTTIRASRGEDIMAACGLLAGSRKKKQEND